MCLLLHILYAYENVVVPMDPLLSSATLPSLTVNQDLSNNDSQVEVTKQIPSVVLSEGPISNCNKASRQIK